MQTNNYYQSEQKWPRMNKLFKKYYSNTLILTAMKWKLTDLFLFTVPNNKLDKILLSM